MTFLRNILLSAGLLVLAGCATRTFTPDQAPEYEISRSFTPFYQQRPVQGATTDISLDAQTRVKLLRKGMGYSFVQLEDFRTGYVANKTWPSPRESQKNLSARQVTRLRSSHAERSAQVPLPAPASVPLPAQAPSLRASN
jgi:hypothetical protein